MSERIAKFFSIALVSATLILICLFVSAVSGCLSSWKEWSVSVEERLKFAVQNKTGKCIGVMNHPGIDLKMVTKKGKIKPFQYFVLVPCDDDY